jgi:endogenous inhibitor of DNA gyrase (YacG/DUF329 family)
MSRSLPRATRPEVRPCPECRKEATRKDQTFPFCSSYCEAAFAHRFADMGYRVCEHCNEVATELDDSVCLQCIGAKWEVTTDA